MFNSQAAVWLPYQIASTTPCPVHSLLPDTSADGRILQRDASGSKLVPRRSTHVYFSTLSKAFFDIPSGTGAETLGVRTARNTNEDVRRLLVNHRLHSTFGFSEG